MKIIILFDFLKVEIYFWTSKMESKIHFGTGGVSFTSFFLFHFLIPKEINRKEKRIQIVQLTTKSKSGYSNQSHKYRLGNHFNLFIGAKTFQYQYIPVNHFGTNSIHTIRIMVK